MIFGIAWYWALIEAVLLVPVLLLNPLTLILYIDYGRAKRRKEREQWLHEHGLKP